PSVILDRHGRYSSTAVDSLSNYFVKFLPIFFRFLVGELLNLRKPRPALSFLRSSPRKQLRCWSASPLRLRAASLYTSSVAPELVEETPTSMDEGNVSSGSKDVSPSQEPALPIFQKITKLSSSVHK
ncbi:hypothetical protein LINGRAHAP2_LOCUS15449, partial [Linum grandiflorum]